MRKIITGVIAVAMLAVPTVANAAVTYDATNDGVITGYVGKGDVQPVLDWNEAKVQGNPVQFSTTLTTVTDKSWKCTNGTTRHNLWTNVYSTEVKSTPVLKSNGKIDGWNLTGLGSTIEVVSSTTTGDAWLNCTGAGSLDYTSLLTEQRHALGTDLFVNGVLLPETPVEVPVA